MISILLVGFDNAGKSTLLANSRTLQPNEMTEILPTNGLSIERILLSNGTNAVVYDCSGGPRYREMWDFFCGECDGVVYVIDSTDRVRLSAVKENIEDFLQHPLLKKKPIAFLVNKQDLPDAVPKDDVKRLLKLDKRSIPNPFTVKQSIGITGEGWHAGLTFIDTNKQTRMDALL